MEDILNVGRPGSQRVYEGIEDVGYRARCICTCNCAPCGSPKCSCICGDNENYSSELQEVLDNPLEIPEHES